MTVHKTLGNGFQEVIYQRALEIEMSIEGLAFNREFEMPIFYREQQIGTRRVDFLAEGIVSVELKAITKLRRCSFGTGNKLFRSIQFRNWFTYQFRRK